MAERGRRPDREAAPGRILRRGRPVASALRRPLWGPPFPAPFPLERLRRRVRRPARRADAARAGSLRSPLVPHCWRRAEMTAISCNMVPTQTFPNSSAVYCRT